MPSQSSPSFIQWRNANEFGKYPFNNLATLVNDTVFIPENVFIDAKLYPVGGGHDQYLYSIERTETSLVFTIGDGSSQTLASGTYSIVSPNEVIKLEDPYGRAAGMLLTDATRMLPLTGWAEALYAFTYDATKFVPTVITPLSSQGVTSIHSSADGTRFTGEVWLVGGLGVTFEVDNTDPSKPVITVHCIGEPLFTRAKCSETGFARPCRLKTINSLEPDDYGNFILGVCGIDATRSVFRIEDVDNGLQMRSTGRTV